MSTILNRLFKISLGVIFTLTGLIFIRPKPTKIIIGFYAGECIGECGTMYQVSAKTIVKDTTTFWQTYPDLSKFVIKRQIVAEKHNGCNYDGIKLNIPLIMLLDPRDSYGCPDCRDQGGYYLQLSILGI